MEHNPEQFYRTVRNKFKFGLFLFTKLPAAWLSGVRLQSVNADRCEVTVPYKWLSQNPFRSTYFACLSMAAEMSTGVLALGYVYKRNPAISMLVIKVDSEYFKKATGKTIFICEDGNKIKSAIEESIASGESSTVEAKSVGRNKEGEVIAEFKVTWSFKSKK